MDRTNQILYLVHRTPYPPNRGDRIRSFRLLERLRAFGDVHLAFLCEEDPPRETMEKLAGLCRQVAAVRLGRTTRWAHAAGSMLQGRTATEGLFHAPALHRTLDRWARQTRFDAVVAFCSSMGQYLDRPELADVPAIVDLCDVDSQKWFEYAAQSRGPKRWLLGLEGRRLRRLEAELSRRAEALAVVSRPEAALYQGFCPTDRLHAIPNGVDLDYFQLRNDGEGAAAPHCVFVGALDYAANIDGVAWFCRHAWPVIHRRRPDARFQIVGSNPAPAVRALAAVPGVTVVGEVPDVRPYLADAAVVVVPLRVARGIQNKVLEGLAMGKAVVATPQALEGIEAEADLHFYEATTADQWVAATCRLFESADVRQRVGQAGRRFVEDNHHWADCLKPFDELLKGIGLVRPSPEDAVPALVGR